MELFVPMRWLKTFLTFGDKLFDETLAELFNKPTAYDKMDTSYYYDRYRKEMDAAAFERKFESWSRSDLIKQIKNYEKEKQSQSPRSLQKKKSVLKEQANKDANKFLGEAFDEAFRSQKMY